MYEILEEIMYFLPLSERSKLTDFIANKSPSAEDAERFIELGGTMLSESKKYGNWWKSSIPQIRAYRQFNCGMLIINFDIYRQDLSKLLKRKVSTAEIFKRTNDIKDEVELAYKMWKFNA